ncbi:MAG: primosomal protein N', partial [Desulfobulbaceae bacterium]|nr:primosomal protein N' [Desulfobulbaceae bacterium]
AVGHITGALDSEAFKTLLLHGITGSGKTWVYIEALRHALSLGKTAIVLVPEISLTPQTASRFRHHFGDKIRVLHSGMSDSEKYEAWQSLRQGKAQIALGPRSAVFAPLSNVGLIIVDEEHESSYKQYDKSPRYNGRDVAIMRAKFENAVCLLGSATPSIESYQNAISGKYDLLTLSKRADEASVPELKIIHLPKDRRVSSSISETLYTEIKKRLELQEQVILFQNRRGFSGSVQCKDCGHIYKCSDCNVPMVYHLRENHLRCHYCGRTADMIDQCPSCGSENLAYKSSGTERIEQELQQLFPTEKILRMDLDTTTKKGSHSKILQSFRDGKASILLGTQMVAKGLDFPNVTLVGVLLADIGLMLPDFRANERLYSLLLQVAGRAGRSQKKGEVFLQVYNLDNDLFRLLLLGDYATFFSYESEIRKMLSYPPYARLAKIEFSGPEEKSVNQSAQFFLKQLCANIDTENFEILGPVPAVLAKLKGKYRYQIIIKQKNGARLTKAVLRNTQYLFL